MLYTDYAGDRKIRVLNCQWRVAKNLYTYFKSAEVEVCAQIKIRTTLAQMQSLGAKKAKEMLINDLIELLYNYRKNCNSQSNPTHLVLPETLKPYPLLLLSILKTPVSLQPSLIFPAVPPTFSLQGR